MRSYLVPLVLVGLAWASTSPAWKDNTEYVYLVNGRTLTSLHELSDQHSGVFLKAKLYITPCSDGNLHARVTVAQYAQIQSRLPDSWNTDIPESQLSYKQLGLCEKPFRIIMERGLIKHLVVEKEMTNWEANIIKSIVSQFQLDIQGNKAVYDQFNQLPRNDKLEGVFRTMEETITGETQTSYDIHPLPEYLIQSQPWLVPKPELERDSQVVEVIKNKNYTNSEESPVYHYGFGELSKGEPTSNKMGEFFLRQSNSRLILTGKLSRFTIQHIQTFNKIIVNPTLNARERGSVVSILNVTLYEVKIRRELSQELVNPVEIGSLVYTYESPFAKSNKVGQKQLEQRFMEESSEETSEEFEPRFRRSVDQASPGLVQCQSRPTMRRAPEFPLLPYYMGYQGRSIKTNGAFDLKKSAERIAKEISEELPDPEQILVHSTLSKYVMLCSLVRLMNDEEMNSVAQQLYTQSKKGQERLAWEAFRDAVAEAGTGPASLNIQKWIESNKIEKEEACEVVSSMAYSVRVPTEEYMFKFFELIKNSKVRNQEHLNETALLSFTRLVNRVYVNQNESHNQYPVHSFRTFHTKEGKEFVKSIVLPYLTKQLHDAVFKADSRKIHVYIRALGNVGDRKILEAFEPYLEGLKQVSQFQRMLMVLSLDKLVISEPVVARSVLYKIYRNKAEVPEVRVVAVYQLMRTVPPVEMIQHMAENTNNEPQEEVNAAVKSAIEYASQLTSPGSQKLRRSAESAKPLLIKKEYGKQQSLNLLQDFVVKNMNIAFKHNLLQVGSVDHDLPKGIKYTVRGNINGMKHYFWNIQAMISSIKELINVFYQQTDQYSQRSTEESGRHQWSSAKIAESLNLQTNEREQLEGFIYSEMESLQRIWSFDNDTIEQLPEVIRQKEELLKNGKEFSYIKLKQLKEMALSFPTEMGIPFLYSYDMPLLIQFEGKIKAIADPNISKNNKLQVPRHIFGQIEAFVTVSTKVQSHLSIVTPFDHQIYTSGFEKNAQAHLPLIGKVNVNLKEQKHNAKFELEVKEHHKDAKLLHYSSWPYTSRSDVMSLEPVSLRQNTRRIRPEGNTHRSFDFIVGKKETGMNIRVWGHHPHQSINLLQLASMLKSEGIATIWQQIWDQSSLQQTEASIAFLPNQSTTRKIILHFQYQKQYQNQPENKNERGFWNSIFSFKKPGQSDNQNNEGFWTMDQLSSKVEYDTKKRQEKIMAYVGAGINSAKLFFFDALVEFTGDRKFEHTFTLAAAKSNVAPQSRFISFYENNAEKPSSFALQIKGYIPNTNELDLSYSLNTAPKSKYEALLQYGHSELQSSKVRATVDLNRSNARKKHLQEKPLYQVCKRQMQEGNRHLPACQNMTIESNFLDDIKVELQYENFRKGCSNSIDSIFKAVRFWYYPITDITTIKPEGQNKINLRIQFQPEHLRQVNVTIKTNDEVTKMYNLPMCGMAKTVFVPHPLFHLKARLVGQIMEKQNIRPTCVLDNKEAQTFSNWTYPIFLRSEWTVMMMYVPQEALLRGQSRQQPVEQLQKQQNNFAVLVRELSAEQREVKITFNHPEKDGKIVEVTMKPKKQGSTSAASVIVDGKEVEFNDRQAADLFNGYVEIYALPSEEVKMEIQGWFYIIFDGDRVKLTATSDKLRDSIVGVCGRFSGDRFEDFWTPNNCIVSSPEKFTKSFIVEGRQQQQPQLQYQECVPKVLPLYADVISDLDVERRENHEEPGFTGTKLRNRYVKENGEICFTVHPVPICKNLARAFITKDIPVHCIAEGNTADYWKNQIDKGGNPNFSQKSPTKTVQLQIPQQCD